MRNYSGYLYILIAVSTWALSSGFLTRWIKEPANVISSLGPLIGSICILIYLYYKKDLSSIASTTKLFGKELLLIGALVGLNNGLFFAALKSTTVANATLTHYLEPVILVAIIAPLLLKSSISKIHLVAAVLGFSGLAVILWPQMGALNIGVIFGAMSALFFAIHTALQKKISDKEVNPFVAAFYTNIVPAIMFSPFVIDKQMNGGIPFDEMGKIIIWGILVFGLSFVLVYEGLKKIKSQVASILFYGEPIGAIIIAALIWPGESITLFTIVGAILIASAGILTIFDHSTKI